MTAVRHDGRAFTGAVGIVMLGAALIGLALLKWPASVAVLRDVVSSGTFRPADPLIPVEDLGRAIRPAVLTVNYLVDVWWALLFGLLIAASVQAFVPRAWLTRVFAGRSMRTQLRACAAGTPLMLCSCCVAPVAVDVFHHTARRIGPALGLLLAAPSMNPAALALTFLLFPREIAVARLLMALGAVFALAAILDRFLQSDAAASVEAAVAPAAEPAGAAGAFLAAFAKTSLRTLPLVVLGVLVSMTLLDAFPLSDATSGSSQTLVIVLGTLIALPMALPTFFEIPLGLMLMDGGVPYGLVAAVLFAGPAVNLPSLLTLGSAAGAKLGVALAAGVFALAVLGGFIVGAS
ncbi:MAG: hypothetical protein GEU99_16205 [Luteitalea sp.]|nr:hypothetical protein [Luteitalea sp.]